MRYTDIEGFWANVQALWAMDSGFDAPDDKTVEVFREAEFSGRGNTWTDVWARYALTAFPGCSYLAISHGSWIKDTMRGFGLGQYFHDERLAVLRKLDVHCAICTVNADNNVEIALLRKNGWERIHEFQAQPKWGNIHWIEIWAKSL